MNDIVRFLPPNNAKLEFSEIEFKPIETPKCQYLKINVLKRILAVFTISLIRLQLAYEILGFDI